MTVSPAIRETGGPPFAGSITPGKSASVRKPLRARKLSRIIRTVDVSRPGGQKSAFEDASKPGVRWSGYIPWNSAHGYCLPCRAAFTDVVGLSLKFAIVSNFRDRKSTRLNSSHANIYTLSLHDALPIWIHPVELRSRVLPALSRSVYRCSGAESQVRHCLEFQRSEEHTSELQSRQYLHSFPTRRSSDLDTSRGTPLTGIACPVAQRLPM